MCVVGEYSRGCYVDVLCSLGGALFYVVCFVDKPVVVQYVDEVCVSVDVDVDVLTLWWTKECGVLS